MRSSWDLWVCGGCNALSRGLKQGSLAQGVRGHKISDPVALPETSAYASGRAVFEAAGCDPKSPPEAAGCKHNPLPGCSLNAGMERSAQMDTVLRR